LLGQKGKGKKKGKNEMGQLHKVIR
jgi:hypothetical protein